MLKLCFLAIFKQNAIFFSLEAEIFYNMCTPLQMQYDFNNYYLTKFYKVIKLNTKYIAHLI